MFGLADLLDEKFDLLDEKFHQLDVKFGLLDEKFASPSIVKTLFKVLHKLTFVNIQLHVL